MTNKIIHGYEGFSKLYLSKLYLRKCFRVLQVLDLPLHIVNQENSIQALQPELGLKACLSPFCSLHWGDVPGAGTEG